MKKEEQYIRLICKRFCAFHKEGKETLYCGTYRYLVSECKEQEIMDTPENQTPAFDEDRWIKENICSKCDFLEDGCGYREGEGTPPCGGYVIVEWLRKKNR
jgi:hypothetical protein